MSDRHGPSTTCGKCGRAVFVTDVDERGLCVFCAPTAKGAAPKVRAPSPRGALSKAAAADFAAQDWDGLGDSEG